MVKHAPMFWANIISAEPFPLRAMEEMVLWALLPYWGIRV